MGNEEVPKAGENSPEIDDLQLGKTFLISRKID